MPAGVSSFDPGALRRYRKAIPRFDRGRPGLSHDELAARLGTTRATVIFYEQGRKQPSPRRLVELARAVGATPQALTSSDPTRATLYDLRVWAGLTQGELAALVGLPRGVYLAVEAGKVSAPLPPETRGRLAEALGVGDATLAAALDRTPQPS